MSGKEEQVVFYEVENEESQLKDIPSPYIEMDGLEEDEIDSRIRVLNEIFRFRKIPVRVKIANKKAIYLSRHQRTLKFSDFFERYGPKSN